MNDMKKDDTNNVYRRLEEEGFHDKGDAASPPVVVVTSQGQHFQVGGTSEEPPKILVPDGNTSAPPECFEVPGFDFSEKSIRRTFIRKVYAVLMSQLLVTLSVMALFMYCRPVHEWARGPQVPLLIYASAAGVGFLFLILMLSTDIRRKAPMNFIFLAIFTIAQGLLLGIVASRVQSSEVLLAFGITAAICLALTLFAFQTKWDFTMCGSGLLVALLVLIIFGLIAAFVPGYRTLKTVYAAACVLVFSLYIVYDTQLMMGGDHKYSISPEEYIFAALNLYLDIINLFIYILRMLR